MTSDDTVESVLNEVRAVDWAAWAIPLPGRLFDYDSNAVLPAFERLVQAGTAAEAQDAYNVLLHSIGHNHSGTPYTAMSPATSLLVRLIPLLGIGGAAGMEVVTDSALWSAGEPEFLGPDGQVHDLGRDTLSALRALEPLAVQWAGQDADGPRRQAGRLLLEALGDLTAP